jgi:tetratricopeptide (TPR) repeat protein
VRYQPEAADAIQRQDWLRAAAAYQQFFAQAAPSAAQIAAADDPTLAPTLADMRAVAASLRTRGLAALNRQAVELAQQGRIAEAVGHFRRVVEVDPDSSHAHYNLARALAAEGVLKEALDEAERAEALSPADPAPQDLVAQLERALKEK